MLRLQCRSLGLLMFLVGGGVGVVPSYVPFSFRAVKLRREAENLQTRESR